MDDKALEIKDELDEKSHKNGKNGSKKSKSKKESTPEAKHLTPSQIVGELDKYIIGQDNAKKSVAIAL